jgi:3-deoxy-D-manno-octulosonic-acid transferase
MPYILNFFYAFVMVIACPWLVYKALTTGRFRRGLWHKLSGRAFRRHNDAPCIWFHGVSVGEIHLLQHVVAAFQRHNPHWHCVVSTTTETGFVEAQKRFAGLKVFWWPLDFTWAVKRALRRVRPDIVVLAEGELWPNFLAAAKRRGVRVAVINGRLSPRSLGRYQKLGGLPRRVWGKLDLVLAQTAEYAANFKALGAPPDAVHVVGSVKYDGASGDRGNPRTRQLRELLAAGPQDLIWIAGSTQSPEEQIVVDIFRRLREVHRNLRMFLVPRQKDRFDEVAALLQRSGLPFIRRTKIVSQLSDRSAIVLVDTIGELGPLWGLADVAFVGGSMDGQRGGQNMIEPAAYGAAVLFGPHVWNFKEPAARLLEYGAAVQVANAETLEREVAHLLESASARHAMGAAGRQFVLTQQGATERTIELLGQLLPGTQSNKNAA